MLKKLLIFPVKLIVRIYQILISPWFPAACRYNPTCSQYMLDALNEWGLFKGLYLGIKRLASCHPWGGNGFDPVPKRIQNKK
ncbi:MAG: membrane protein insertion efficiency factor YidD [Flavobacteriales bacterium]